VWATIALVSLRGALAVVTDMLSRDAAVVEGAGYKHTDSSDDSVAFFYRIGTWKDSGIGLRGHLESRTETG